ncbi:unnamed protein product [Brachionus calyciflorus]|uniref:G-protein coupled receptors family 1 profile domain-containing protein n=1 Tax=Brachionus calyciflorus TaxID=104777 RepID=A0A813SYX6_9BILA|nr:unnamed protein product [Brachionus calyciflorus]
MPNVTNSTNQNDSLKYSFEISSFDEDITQIGVTKLTRVLAVIGVCICIIGIIGNLFSIIVLSRKSMKRLSTYSYLLGLSICDEISLSFTVIILFNYAAPTILLKSIVFTNNYKILLIYLYPIVSSTQALSVWITLAFTVDRYVYVCHPYYGRIYCTRHKALIVISCLFILATIYSIPQFLERTYISVEIIDDNFQIFQSLTDFGRNHYFIYIYHLLIYSLFICLIPIIMIVILNGFLIFDIIKSNKRHRELHYAYTDASTRSNLNSISEIGKRSISINNYLKPPKKIFSCLKPKKSREEIFDLDSSCTERCIRVNGTGNSTVTAVSFPIYSGSDRYFNDKTLRNDVTIMLIGLIFVFLICQSPSTVLRLITFKNLSIYFKPIYYSSLDVSNFLIVTNSTLNCILYVMLGKKFRKEFIKTFFKKCSHENS